MNMFIILPDQLFITKEILQNIYLHDKVIIFEATEPSSSAKRPNARLFNKYVNLAKKINANTIVKSAKSLEYRRDDGSANPAKGQCAGRNFIESLVGQRRVITLICPTDYVKWAHLLAHCTFNGIAPKMLKSPRMLIDPSQLPDNVPSFSRFMGKFAEKIPADFRRPILPYIRQFCAKKGQSAFCPANILAQLDQAPSPLSVPRDTQYEGKTGEKVMPEMIGLINKYIDKHLLWKCTKAKRPKHGDIFSQNIIALLNAGILTVAEYISKIIERLAEVNKARSAKAPNGLYQIISREIMHLGLYNYIYFVYLCRASPADHENDRDWRSDFEGNLREIAPAHAAEIAKKAKSAGQFRAECEKVPWMEPWMAVGLWHVMHMGQR